MRSLLERDRKLAACAVLLEDSVERPKFIISMSGHATGHSAANGSAQFKTSGKVSVMKAVKAAITEQTGTFTGNDLVEIMKKRFPALEATSSRDISNPLWMLRNKGEIVLVEKGNGREPSLYRKA